MTYIQGKKRASATIEERPGTACYRIGWEVPAGAGFLRRHT